MADSLQLSNKNKIMYDISTNTFSIDLCLVDGDYNILGGENTNINFNGHYYESGIKYKSKFTINI